MRRFELYHFTHEDGSAKAWAYHDQGNGLALIRWGPAGQLRSQQEKPLRIALQRAQEKRRKGYVHQGQVTLDARGRQVRRVTEAQETQETKASSAPTTQTVSREALLGPGSGFYF